MHDSVTVPPYTAVPSGTESDTFPLLRLPGYWGQVSSVPSMPGLVRLYCIVIFHQGFCTIVPVYYLTLFINLFGDFLVCPVTEWLQSRAVWHMQAWSRFEARHGLMPRKWPHVCHIENAYRIILQCCKCWNCTSSTNKYMLLKTFHRLFYANPQNVIKNNQSQWVDGKG